MKFLKWIEYEQILIELSGEVCTKVIDTNVSCVQEPLILRRFTSKEIHLQSAISYTL